MKSAKKLLALILLSLPVLSFAQKLNSGIETTVIQDISRSGKKAYFLDCRTINEYCNGNILITYKKKTNNNGFNITFTGTKRPGKGTRNTEPARVRIPIGHLKKGEYDFVFRAITDNNEINWTGKLIVQDTLFNWNTIMQNQ